MEELSAAMWLEGFEDLEAHPERAVLCVGEVSFCVTPGACPDGSPGLAIRLTLPDGRAAVAGLKLMGMLESLLSEATACGWAVVAGGGVLLAVPHPKIV